MTLPPPPGGAFLGNDAACTPLSGTIFAPEKFGAEARLLADAVKQFVRGAVVPVNERLEEHEPGLMADLLRQAGSLGFLGVGIPEAYGGLDLPKSQIALLFEKAAIHPSFAISAGVHSGVAALPLLFFGSSAQRARYLPELASGASIGAFALTEADSGSDALNARARASLAADRSHYTLNGSKMWITNGAFADLLTVFAQMDEGGLGAFLVERQAGGVNASREERKLGLRGSSTTRIELDSTPVPAANLLGEPGKGHRPALYSLNLGRLTIAATALGMCKENLAIAARFARERRQFGKPLTAFGLIRQKLARMAIGILTLESLVYRTAGYLDRLFAEIDPGGEGAQERYRRAAEEYAVECAIAKTFGAETLDFVVDEALQIHGGYGFSEEFSIAQAYRDARVFRIFEGTSEINRLTMVDQVARRLRSDRLDLGSGVGLTVDDGAPADTIILSLTRNALRLALDRFGGRLDGHQEVSALLADLMIACYAAQSVRLRCAGHGRPGLAEASAAAMEDAAVRSRLLYRTLLAECGAPEPVQLPVSANSLELERVVADAVVSHDGYPW